MNEILLLFLTVPVITAAIGWVTNWAAVKMIFHPEKFVGVGPVGWQGILFKQSHKFASGVADMATDNLISAKELAQRLDPEEMEKLFGDVLDAQSLEMCHEAAEIIQPGAWDMLPEPVRQMAVAQVKQRTREMTRELFDELQGVSDELVDINTLIYSQLSGANVRRLAALTKKIGKREFKFIEYYGGVFGFLIGLAQIGIWSLMQIWWLMPIVGVIVGLGTNYLAIQMIFRPQEPRKYFGVFTYQGLFAKRQPEISADYGQVAGDELLTPKNLIKLMTEGETGEKIATLVSETISSRLDEEWKKVEKMVPVEVTDEHIEKIKDAIVRRVTSTAPEVQPEVEEYLERKLDVTNTVRERMSEMSKPKFERLLRGIFEEDELTLIIVGGFLGGCVGIAQGMLVLTL
jgi:uncharacterized membrane protein YheB (UPF0754 family)